MRSCVRAVFELALYSESSVHRNELAKGVEFGCSFAWRSSQIGDQSHLGDGAPFPLVVAAARPFEKPRYLAEL